MTDGIDGWVQCQNLWQSAPLSNGKFCMPVQEVVAFPFKFNFPFGKRFPVFEFPFGKFLFFIPLKRGLYTVKIKNTRWKALKLSLASIKIKFPNPIMRIRLPVLKVPSRSGLKKQLRNFPNGQELPVWCSDADCIA